jgi:hypothetical protein
MHLESDSDTTRKVHQRDEHPHLDRHLPIKEAPGRKVRAVKRQRYWLLAVRNSDQPASQPCSRSRQMTRFGRLGRRAAGNPLAAGLIAVGVGWLVGSLLPASSAEERAATKPKEAAAPAVSGAAKDAAASLQDSAKQAAESVKATAADSAATVKDETVGSAHDIRDQVQAARDTVTDSRR